MDEICSNPGHENKFTCPACLTDFNGVKTIACPGCGAEIHCYVEQQPVCVCELGLAESDED